MPMTTANRSGTSIVETRKARPRICSRYSRRATSRMLRIGLASHGLNEDFFERRFDEFEAVDGGDGCGLVEELLRVAVGVKTDLGVATVVVGLGDFRALQERGVSFELDDDAVALVA